jgi:hypothetical protein
MRFTMTRAVSGFCALAIQSARALRRCCSGGFFRQLQITERGEHGGGDGLLRLLRIAAIEEMDVIRRAEGASEDFLRVLGGFDLGFDVAFSWMSGFARLASSGLRPLSVGFACFCPWDQISAGRSHRRRFAIGQRCPPISI